MNKYLEVIYNCREKSNYPSLLVEHLDNKYYHAEKNASLLDVGCGDQTFTKEFTKRGYIAKGIDNDDIDFESHTKWEIENNHYDYIFSKSVIEHIYNTKHLFSEMFRILKPGGKIIIMTPSWEHVYRDFYNDFTHVKPFHRKGLQDCLKIHGFSQVKVEYFYQLPFLWSYKWLKPLIYIIQFLPDSWKWKDNETKHNKLIRFSKEVMLLATAVKI